MIRFNFCRSFTGSWVGYCNSLLTTLDTAGADCYNVLWNRRVSKTSTIQPKHNKDNV